MMKKLLFIAISFVTLSFPLYVAAQVTTVGGGTGSTSPSGILYGVTGNLHLQTVKLSGLTFSGGTLTATGGTGASTTLLADTNTFSGHDTFSNTITGSISGNAGTATALATGRTLSITGDLSYTSPTFDGSGNVTAAGTLATVNTNVGSFTNANITVNGKGLITAASNGTAADTFAWPFTPTTYGNATSSTLGFTLGFLSVGSSTIVGNATTTGMHAFGSVRIPTLGTAAGSFIAVDPNGVIIATTTPSGSNSAFSPSANYATATALPSNTYLAGVITAVANGALSVDGANPSVGQRVLVKNESTAANNGLYDVTTAGSAIAAFVLTRDAQYNSSSNIIPGIITYVISGSTNDDDFWAMTSAAPITVGTTALNYTEVSGGGAGVVSVSNSDNTLTITPTTGNVIASLNLGHSNTWSVLQDFTNATSTLFSTTYASSTNYFGANLASCNTASSALTWNNGFFGCNTITGGAAYPFTPATFGINVSATSTPLYPAGLITGTSTIGTLVASSSITNQAVKSALVLSGAGGLEGAYGGAAGCTNQVVTALSAVGATTCTSLTAAMFGNVTANTVFGNFTGASAAPTFTATSSLFTGSTGQFGYFSGTGALVGTSSIFVATNQFIGIGSTTPFAALSLDRKNGLASSTIAINEYGYGAATTTAETVDCRTSSQSHIGIGTSATTITITGMITGQSCRIIVENPNAGTPGALTWAVGTGYLLLWAGGTVPTATATNNKQDVYSFIATKASSTVDVLGAQSANF